MAAGDWGIGKELDGPFNLLLRGYLTDSWDMERGAGLDRCAALYKAHCRLVLGQRLYAILDGWKDSKLVAKAVIT